MLKKYLAVGPKDGLKLASLELPYELLTDGGDVVLGKSSVNGHLAANCTACHRIDSDECSEVGPTLSQVDAQRTKTKITESLIEPSAKIVADFGIETMVLKDGNSLA